jgi:predicted peptidase
MSLQHRTHKTPETQWNYLYGGPAAERAAGAPLLVFLHGARDRGGDLNLLLRWSPPKALNAATALPYHFVAPQLPADTTWVDHAPAVLQLIDAVANEVGADPSRVVIAGFSLGSAGAWHLASKHPSRFAGLVSVSSRIDESLDFQALSVLPIWIFNGGRDDKLPAGQTDQAIAALRQHGGEVRHTHYPQADHFISEEAYGNAELNAWISSRQAQPA